MIESMELTCCLTANCHFTGWIVEHWARATPFLAIYTIIILVTFALPQDKELFLLWLQTPSQWMQQFEEFLFPGNFNEYFNIEVVRSTEKNWPLTDLTSFWINVPLGFCAFPFSCVVSGYIGVGYGIWTPYFSVFYAIIKVCLFFVRGKYVPGLVVGILINLPLGVYTIWSFQQTFQLPIHIHIIGVEIALAYTASILIYWLKFLRHDVVMKSMQFDQEEDVDLRINNMANI